jgi:hypothetical protein
MNIRKKFSAMSILHIMQDMFDEEIKVFQTYIIEVTSQFETKAAELNRLYLQHIEEEWQNALDDEMMKNAEYHPKILNSSTLIALQTLLEKTLLQVIRRSSTIFNQPVSITNTRTLEDMLATLTQKFGVQIPAAERMLLDDFRKVRNLFVHYGGNLFNDQRAGKKEEIEQIVKNDNRLILNQHTGELIIYDNQYLISYAAAIQRFCKAIFYQLIASHDLILASEN